MKRQWKLEVSPGQQIKLNFLFLNLEEDPHCHRDFLVLQDGARSREVARICGNILPSEFNSQTNVLWVLFQSNEKSVYTGFKIHYKAVDGKSYCQ